MHKTVACSFSSAAPRAKLRRTVYANLVHTAGVSSGLRLRMLTISNVVGQSPPVGADSFRCHETCMDPHDGERRVEMLRGGLGAALCRMIQRPQMGTWRRAHWLLLLSAPSHPPRPST